ncbi:MAG: HD domain-containing protein [Lachnospiraceae bacterium]|nr:HD domain-containing protein [Lachnospiraceae bacterium]
MMDLLEEAIIYATVMHQGKLRKFGNIPYILHPMEVAQILSTITDDKEIITAGILHDVVEDTDGTLQEIEKRFGKRVAFLVDSESENKYPGQEESSTWKQRKEESLRTLKNTTDNGVRMLWLADKLANIRSLAGMYSEKGEEMWQNFHQSDPQEQCWYYSSVAETVELYLNKTGAFKEFIRHINSIWPGTFDSDKARFKKYREVSVEGCELLGRGAKGDVYRYNDELVVKVFNEKNTYHDVEMEIAKSRKAFVLGVPTAISFGIVSVGDRYGAMFEMVNSDTLSRHIARAPGQVGSYARIMADVAHSIHEIKAAKDDGFPPASERIRDYISGGVALEDAVLGEKCMKLIDSLPETDTLIHGDFHTGNVFLQNGEPLIIDMDRVSVGHPIAELSDLYYFYVILGEDDPSVVEEFKGFSYDTAKEFFGLFLRAYLGTEDENRLSEVSEKASIIGYSRLIRKLRKKGEITGADRDTADMCLAKLKELTDRIDTLEF